MNQRFLEDSDTSIDYVRLVFSVWLPRVLSWLLSLIGLAKTLHAASDPTIRLSPFHHFDVAMGVLLLFFGVLLFVAVEHANQDPTEK